MIRAIGSEVTKKRNLVPERPDRSFPRVVKRRGHNSYRIKRATDTGTTYKTPPTVVIHGKLAS